MEITDVTVNDYSEIDMVIRQAFENTDHGYHQEAKIARTIRADASFDRRLEVEAKKDNVIVGHAMLSEIKVVGSNLNRSILCLAPVSVLPNNQKAGVGTAMIEELERRAKKTSYPAIHVLGWPKYYARFGYRPASNFGIKAPFEVDDNVVMIKELMQNSLTEIQGTIEYSQAFNV